MCFSRLTKISEVYKMMLTEKNRDEFYKIADSLKRFKRAEIKDSQERSLINTLYTDLLPEN